MYLNEGRDAAKIFLKGKETKKIHIAGVKGIGDVLAEAILQAIEDGGDKQ